MCPPKVSRKRIRHKRVRASVVVASYECDIGFQGGTRGTEGNTSISGWLLLGNLVYGQPNFRGFLECGGNDDLSDTHKLIQHHLADESFRCPDLNRLEGGDGHRGPKKLKKISLQSKSLECIVSCCIIF